MIDTERNYNKALARIEKLMNREDLDTNLRLANELERLVDEVVEYEEIHYPMEDAE